MCGINNISAFKGSTNHKRKEDILLFISLFKSVVSCQCKGYDWEQPLLCSCSPSICYHLNRIVSSHVCKKQVTLGFCKKYQYQNMPLPLFSSSTAPMLYLKKSHNNRSTIKLCLLCFCVHSFVLIITSSLSIWVKIGVCTI